MNKITSLNFVENLQDLTLSDELLIKETLESLPTHLKNYFNQLHDKVKALLKPFDENHLIVRHFLYSWETL